MTSLLLTVIVNREGSHWVLATFLSIRGLYPHSIQWREEMYGSLTSYSGILGLPIHLPHFARVHLHLTSFTERILPSSCLSYVRYDLGSILGCLSSYDVMTRLPRLLGLINISASESGEKVYYPIPPPGVVQTQESKLVNNPNWCVGWLKDSEFHIRLTCIINVFALHEPPSYLRKINYFYEQN